MMRHVDHDDDHDHDHDHDGHDHGELVSADHFIDEYPSISLFFLPNPSL